MWQYAYRRLGPVSRGQFVSSPFSRLYRLAVVAIAVTAAVLVWPAPALHAGGVVGDGTPASCDSNAFAAALVGGGAVTFNCGAAAHTIIADTYVIPNGDVVSVDGGDLITLDGELLRQIFRVDAGAELALENIILTRGYTWGVNESPGLGGAIYNEGTLTINNSTVRDSRAEGEAAYGGGIENLSGAVSIHDSFILNNYATLGGGGLDNNTGGTVYIGNTLVEGNTGEAYAGIDNGGTMTIVGSTIRNNVASLARRRRHRQRQQRSHHS